MAYKLSRLEVDAHLLADRDAASGSRLSDVDFPSTAERFEDLLDLVSFCDCACGAEGSALSALDALSEVERSIVDCSRDVMLSAANHAQDVHSLHERARADAATAFHALVHCALDGRARVVVPFLPRQVERMEKGGRRGRGDQRYVRDVLGKHVVHLVARDEILKFALPVDFAGHAGVRVRCQQQRKVALDAAEHFRGVRLHLHVLCDFRNASGHQP